MKVGKPQSKRVPVRLRHKIQKASAAKQKKQRKEEKKNPQWRSRLKKDPGIPNLFPYKAKVLAEIEESRRKKEEDFQRKKDLAKAQKQGKAVRDTMSTVNAEDEDDEILDDISDEDDTEGGEMEVQDESNPMAALLASAQARAKTYGRDETSGDVDNDDDAGAEDVEWRGIDAQGQGTASTLDSNKPLPRQALEDPVKAVAKVVERMQDIPSGVERLIEYYKIPTLVTTGTDFTTRYLVEVARKRGRLGRGGVPNLHAAALTVLADLHEKRLQLPAVQIKQSNKVAVSSGSASEVRIVSALAEPFKLEGLWGDEDASDVMNV